MEWRFFSLVLGAALASSASGAFAVPTSFTVHAPIKGETVYVTRSGKHYHRANCRYWDSSRTSKIRLSPRDAKKRGYSPCQVCKPGH
jgi:hypothetical protein